MATKTQKQEHK